MEPLEKKVNSRCHSKLNLNRKDERFSCRENSQLNERGHTFVHKVPFALRPRGMAASEPVRNHDQ